MRLASFAVRNFRSITSTSKLTIRDSITTLIGPNNEGKSNVLRALVAALEVASRLNRFTLSRTGRLRAFHGTERFYQWDTDYPIALQEKKPDGESEFDLEFELTTKEIDEFWKEVGSSINGILPIRISLGTGAPSFTVRKKGPGAKALSAKASRIATFIGRRIDLQYIPAVRPAAAATSVVENMVASQLQMLAVDDEYQEAVRRIEELQQPLLKTISEGIRETLKEFLPNVKDVQVHVPRDARYRALSRSCEVIVDDGSPTTLARKGDGVQSLAALSLMRHASQRSTEGKQVLLAIEEPESHLHPSAIQQLRAVLLEVAKQHQVIITTHCPLFVDRHDARANILVTANRAASAHSIKQIRETMGVRVSDNLVAAEVLLLVEGEEDRRAMRALLAHFSGRLRRALHSGVFAIDTLAGGGNLSYKLTQARETMCIAHCLVDHDMSGQIAVRRAIDESLLALPDLTYTTCLGMKESELEDWYDSTVVAAALAKHFGVPLHSPYYTGVKRKWSERMRELFSASGKPWDSMIEMQVKWRVAEAVTAAPSAALLPARKSAFDSLLTSLEQKLARA